MSETSATMPATSRQKQPVAPSLREQAYREIRRRILDEEFKPGMLLSENKLAVDLQISRTPIREALRDLTAGGLVKALPSRGIFVADLSLKDVIEVYELREQLECLAVRLAAAHAGQPALVRMRADHALALDRLRARRLREAYDHAMRLHDSIIELSGNNRLQQFMRQLGDQVHRFGLLTLRQGRLDQTLTEHGGIIDAIARHDIGAAENLMRGHLRSDRDMVIRLILPVGLSPARLLSPGAAEPILPLATPFDTAQPR